MALRYSFLALIFLLGASSPAQVQSVGDVSFAVPDSWTYQGIKGDYASMILKRGERSWVIAVCKPLVSTGNADADFRLAWTKVVGSAAGVPEPIYDYKSFAGYSGKYATTNDAQGRLFWLYALATGRNTVPVLVVSRNRADFNELENQINQVVDSVRLGSDKATPIKGNVVLADMIGTWRSGAESSVNYVDSATGTYAGTSIAAHGQGYTIAADGTYTYQFAGVSNRNIVRGQGSGRVEITQDGIILREKGGNTHRYRPVSYQHALNGATVLTLLDANYEVTSANINFYAERWVRDPVRK